MKIQHGSHSEITGNNMKYKTEAYSCMTTLVFCVWNGHMDWLLGRVNIGLFELLTHMHCIVKSICMRVLVCKCRYEDTFVCPMRVWNVSVCRVSYLALYECSYFNSYNDLFVFLISRWSRKCVRPSINRCNSSLPSFNTLY
mgnify:CR=1 FL=1